MYFWIEQLKAFSLNVAELVHLEFSDYKKNWICGVNLFIRKIKKDVAVLNRQKKKVVDVEDK